MKEYRDTPRSTMSDKDMVKDYSRLVREYTLLHQDYREAIRKLLNMPVVSSCLIKHIKTTVKIQRELWDNCDKKNTAQERKLNGKYMAYKELADGLRNNFFNNC